MDVRAPLEFKRGSIPGAVNLPLMDDNQRHLVGIEYKKAGQERAIALGAKLLPDASRATLLLQWQAFASAHPGGALYCFRGGLRSLIVQEWLSDAGMEYPLVVGGYKAMRTHLIEQLERCLKHIPLVLIGGRTGSGKTTLLHRLKRHVDLEGLANHRGSSFGKLEIPQPSNIDFEHAVTLSLMRLKQQSNDRVFMEDEARMIGSACLPQTLRESMLSAPVVVLDVPVPVRVRASLHDYVTDLLARYQARDGLEQGFEAYAEHHRQSLSRVQKRLGGKLYIEACHLLEDALKQHKATANVSTYEPFIELLLTRYYDPMYDYQTQKKQHRVVFSGDADEIFAWAEANHA